MKVGILVNGKRLKCWKIAYKTRKIAWRSALADRKRFANTATPYKCHRCKKFHLATHSEGTPPKEMVA